MQRREKMEKRVPLQTTEHKFFKQILELLNPMLKLRHKELDVLAEIMYQYNTLSTVPKEHRMRIVLDAASRKSIRQKINQSEAAFNNNLSKLKKYKYITETGLMPALDFPYVSGFKLTFIFNGK